MHDYDSEFIWDYEISCHDFLEESNSYSMENTYDLDEDYNRDSQDWQQLAYIHFAWYNNTLIPTKLMLPEKRFVRVTLDIECYDDFDVENTNWDKVLELQENESVNLTQVEELDPFVYMGWSDYWG